MAKDNECDIVLSILLNDGRYLMKVGKFGMPPCLVYVNIRVVVMI